MIWNGHVLIGDGLGLVHCLELHSGRRLWRLQAAPAQRRMLWYGHLVNTWPITGAMSVDDNGVAYVLAGYQPENGVHAYAVDIATGELRWQRHDLGSGFEYGVDGTIGNYGDTCIADGRLWIAASLMVPPTLDLDDGKLTLIPNNRKTSLKRRGITVAALADDWVITGGRRLSTTHDLLMTGDKGCGWSVYRADNTYEPETIGGIDVIKKIKLAPIWDAQLMVTASQDEGGIRAFSRTDMEAAFQTAFASPATCKPWVKPVLDTALPEVEALWGPTDKDTVIVGMVLAADALLWCRGEPDQEGLLMERWFLEALDRKSGTVRWSVALPEQPIYDGITIDRDGRILVVMRDGSVALYQTL